MLDEIGRWGGSQWTKHNLSAVHRKWGEFKEWRKNSVRNVQRFSKSSLVLKLSSSLKEKHILGLERKISVRLGFGRRLDLN